MGEKTKSVDFGYLNDGKLDKAADSVAEDAKNWKGGSSKERKEERAKEKEMKKKMMMRRQQEESSNFKKKVGGCCAIVFMTGVGLFSFLSTVYDAVIGDGVYRLDIADTGKLKTVLFGGDPWLIYCVDNRTEKMKLPEVLTESTTPLWRNLGTQVGVLHCWDETASGRSIAKRFNLKLTPPLQFVVANGNKPKKLDLVGLSKPEDLEKKIKPWMEVSIDKVDTLKKWPALCTGRRTCVIVGHKQQAQKDTALNVIKPLIENHRGTKFVTIDTAFWQLKLDEKLLQTRASKEASKGADVLCLARDEPKAAGGNATYSGTFLKDLSASAVSSFVKACESRSGLVETAAAPKFSARKTKPKKVKPPTPRPPTPRPPTPPAERPQPRPRGNVDSVGSRASMEKQAEQEALFEAVDEDEGEEGAEDEEEEDDDGDEVEL
eukprot:TRINITY_DN112289_c0_g1_i1.p1 TRINITY_DN112289_c0_g1~~TRINITY_DN112289_c0_g1_i1.p1  ORF type:complete len:434 (+),score=153.17 TRINITY_DN112289_c0_g1_i1:189-1490(+)